MDPFDQRCGVDPAQSTKLSIPQRDIHDQHKRRLNEGSQMLQSGLRGKSKEVVKGYVNVRISVM